MENIFTATGKRKCAIASVVIKHGTGKKVCNGASLIDYLKSETLIADLVQPLDLVNKNDSLDITIKVIGGGLTGQSGAIRLGIARAIAQISEEDRKALRKAGFLTRDSRIVERKKYGQPGARKRFQFSKR